MHCTVLDLSLPIFSHYIVALIITVVIYLHQAITIPRRRKPTRTYDDKFTKQHKRHEAATRQTNISACVICAHGTLPGDKKYTAPTSKRSYEIRDRNNLARSAPTQLTAVVACGVSDHAVYRQCEGALETIDSPCAQITGLCPLFRKSRHLDRINKHQVKDRLLSVSLLLHTGKIQIFPLLPSHHIVIPFSSLVHHRLPPRHQINLLCRNG